MQDDGAPFVPGKPAENPTGLFAAAFPQLVEEKQRYINFHKITLLSGCLPKENPSGNGGSVRPDGFRQAEKTELSDL